MDTVTLELVNDLERRVEVPFNVNELAPEFKTAENNFVKVDKEAKLFLFEGFASTFGNTDLDNEVIARGAFTESLQRRVPKLFWQHDSREPLGAFISLVENEQGLFVSAKMPLNDTFVSGRVVPQIEIGAINSMSIGFRVRKSVHDEDTGIRTFLEVELFEISLVSIPANPAAIITGTSFKNLSAKEFIDLPAREQERALREGVNFSSLAAKRLVSYLKECKIAYRDGKLNEMHRDGATEQMKKLVNDLVINRDGNVTEKMKTISNLLKE